MNFSPEDRSILVGNKKVNVFAISGQGQPRCFPFCNPGRIEIFLENDNVPNDLIHEKTHYDIFPYDFISYALLYSAVVGTTLAQPIPSFTKALMITAETFGFVIAHNLYSDILVNLADKLKLNRGK